MTSYNPSNLEANLLDSSEWAPRVLPVGWKEIHHPAFNPEGHLYLHRSGLKVIFSVSIERDGRRWLHVSCSYADHLPTWEDLGAVKAIFVGRERAAIQVLPPESRRVDFHHYCLHLWSCLDESPVPDFTRQLEDGRNMV